MEKKFFTSKEAAQITDCSLRQLQYWREKGLIVPSISATGTGRSIYYSPDDVFELAVMKYLLSVGLGFEVACSFFTALRTRYPEYVRSEAKQRFMLNWDDNLGKLKLDIFDQEEAIAALEQGRPIIPVWLDVLSQKIKIELSEIILH